MLFGCECKIFRYLILFLVIILYALTLYLPEIHFKKRRPVKQVFGWESNVTRDVRVYVAPGNQTLIIDGVELCEGKIDVLVLVFSAPENVVRRSAIRQTWASSNTSGVRVGFLLGWTANSSIQEHIEEESRKYHDIVQENFHDTYNNLTIKSVMMLKWFLRFCQSSRFLMKTDDDMFVNVTNLSATLKRINSPAVLIGSLICHAKPISNFHSKWYTPKYMFKKEIYPNYLSGTGYVMSKKVAIKLFLAALTTPLIHLEDVYLTGICAEKAHVRPRNHGGFTYHNLGTKCLRHMITNHRLTPQELHVIWNNRNNCTFKPVPRSTRRTKIQLNKCF